MSDGGGFGVAAGAMLAMMQRDQDRRDDPRWLFDRMHQVPLGPLQVPLVAGNGAYQMNDFLMPKAGYMWSVRRITASGYSAGSVVVYKGGNVVGGTYTGGGDPIPFSTAGANTLGRGEFLLDQGDALVIVCTGITLLTGFAGVQITGAADCFKRELLPDYLM